ncbi:hypothetical protein GCM10025857_50760 [Alicyclobacillus contaminans]|uniref:Aminotransferase class V domain-containing protein n=1 Tax=Tetragenococcus osmophilus TaxID=526944 RepID=A0AA37XM17_9ENTE|nr:hypothetical protein GCM10025857_50760 [Alicyclobacillus contaminans]GMA72350.1 hypothetical protein GCM10025885_13990 [Tetragenococcus osmophilus]
MVYLDHAATTPMRPEVIEEMTQVMKKPSETLLAFINMDVVGIQD